MNKHQENALNVIEKKLKSNSLEIENMEVIYNFLMYKNKKEWNLRNCYLSGFGECLASNQDLTPEEIEKFKDFWSSYNIIILKNKITNEFNCLLLPPAMKKRTGNDLIENPLAPLDKIDQNNKTKNWNVTNVFDDELTIAPYTFDKDYEFIDLLTPTLISFNDLLCEKLSKDEYPLFSKMVVNTYNFMNDLEKQNKNHGKNI